jgi:hypothetical protein
VQVDGSGKASTRVDLEVQVQRHRGQTVEASKPRQGNSGISEISDDFSSTRGNLPTGAECTNRGTLCTIRTTSNTLSKEAILAKLALRRANRPKNACRFAPLESSTAGRQFRARRGFSLTSSSLLSHVASFLATSTDSSTRRLKSASRWVYVVSPASP